MMRYIKFFLANSIFVSMVFCFQNFHAQAQSASDFSNDINLIKNQKSLEENISTKEYVSAWDEFGMSNLVSGEVTPSEIHTTIDQDITQTVEKELQYDKEESKYLEDTHTTPEEMKAIEGADGSDVPDDAMFNPHPSLEVNPEVNTFSTEVDSEKQIESSIVINSSSTDSSVTDVSTSTDNSIIKVSPESATNDTEIYKAILQGEDKSPTETKAVDTTPGTSTTPGASNSSESSTPKVETPQKVEVQQVEVHQTQQQ